MSLSVVDSAISYDDAGTTWNSNAFTKTTSAPWAYRSAGT